MGGRKDGYISGQECVRVFVCRWGILRAHASLCQMSLAGGTSTADNAYPRAAPGCDRESQLQGMFTSLLDIPCS